MQTFVLQDGLSPLHTSCLKGHLDVVNTLIDAAANINQANKVSAYITTCVCLVIKVTKFHHYIFYDQLMHTSQYKTSHQTYF